MADDARIELPPLGRLLRSDIPAPGRAANKDQEQMFAALEAISSAVMTEPHWRERADGLLACIETVLVGWTDMPRDETGFGMSGILTIVIEKLEEAEVVCLQQAAIYALCMHAPWRAAGREWLLPHRKTELADWVKDRPTYRRLARLVGMAHRDVPSWLKEVAR
ncbi:hypothetical protein [Azospirillum sp. B2RO_4]|uniref:hypothetical protein n=1 Tax=Azospirillum sp. B2RO_4 TaxID=3027796 RepID=UPI003DA96F20